MLTAKAVLSSETSSLWLSISKHSSSKHIDTKCRPAPGNPGNGILGLDRCRRRILGQFILLAAARRRIEQGNWNSIFAIPQMSHNILVISVPSDFRFCVCKQMMTISRKAVTIIYKA